MTGFAISPNSWVMFLQKEVQYLGQKGVTSIPLLVSNTKNDHMNPVSEIKAIAEISTKGQYRILMDRSGHTPSQEDALALISKFFMDNKR